MAIYSWRLIQGGNESVDREMTEWDDVYIVRGYTQGINPAWVDLSADRPDLYPGQPHPSITYARSELFEPERLEDTEDWQVTVTWRIAIRGEDDGDEQAELDISPLLRPAKITTDYEVVEVPTIQWVDAGGTVLPVEAGDEIQNTAGDIIHGVTREDVRWNFRFEKNIAVYPSWLLEYAGAVNSDAISIGGLVVDAEYLKITSLSISERQQEVVNDVRIYYYTLFVTLTYNPQTWETKLLNQGLYQYSGATYTPCVDSEGEPVSEPAFLDAAGAQLPPDTKVAPEDIVIINGWLSKKLPFAVLPLS